MKICSPQKQSQHQQKWQINVFRTLEIKQERIYSKQSKENLFKRNNITSVKAAMLWCFKLPCCCIPHPTFVGASKISSLKTADLKTSSLGWGGTGSEPPSSILGELSVFNLSTNSLETPISEPFFI